MDIIGVLNSKKTTLRRSKSLCSLNEVLGIRNAQFLYAEKRRRSRVDSDSSEAFVVHHADSDTSLEEPVVKGVIDVEHLTHLEEKMDRLTDLFLEQCRLLSSIKGEVQNSREVIEKSGNMYISQLAQLANSNGTNQLKGLVSSEAELMSSRSRLLLDAIERAHTSQLAHAPSRELGDAIASFLQSDDLAKHVVSVTGSSVRDVMRSCITRDVSAVYKTLKFLRQDLTERVVSATAASVREVMQSCIARDVSAVYLPVLQRAHCRLARYAARTLEEAFVELEEHSAQASRHMYRASRQLQRALDRQQGALDRHPPNKLIDSLRTTAERVLDSEMKQWRQKIMETMSLDTGSESECRSESPTPSDDYLFCTPISPLSADSEHSPIDRLMQAAEINKQIEDGDVNGSFERALCSMDLSLVVAACRAAGPARVFGPCRLRHHVLLALLQQLATDMLTDTHLKCRYLEEAIISLNVSNPQTRAHLPTVVGEVRKHLMKFLVSYPNHVASRRITLIVMAADNLLK